MRSRKRSPTRSDSAASLESQVFLHGERRTGPTLDGGGRLDADRGLSLLGHWRAGAWSRESRDAGEVAGGDRPILPPRAGEALARRAEIRGREKCRSSA